MKTIDEIRKALYRIHARAMGDTSVVYMSVPADHQRDADLSLSAAIDELEAFRNRENTPDIGIADFLTTLDPATVIEGGRPAFKDNEP